MWICEPLKVGPGSFKRKEKVNHALGMFTCTKADIHRFTNKRKEVESQPVGVLTHKRVTFLVQRGCYG